MKIIKSREGYYKSRFQGYTNNIKDAHIYTDDEAEYIVSHDPGNPVALPVPMKDRHHEDEVMGGAHCAAVSPAGYGVPKEDKDRKGLPVFEGVIKYFPDAILEVAKVSRVGNDQHNPGQPLGWDKAKSTNQTDTALRHMMDHHAFGTRYDTDGTRHLAKAAWRTLAALQLDIEAEREDKQI